MRRRGFTLIEMLVVFVIISILAGMSLPGILPMIGRSKLRKGAEAIVTASREARQYATNRSGDGLRAYGICVAADASGRYFATVIEGGPGDGKANHLAREVKAPDDTPALRRYLPAGADVWVGSQTLAQSPSKELAWYYEGRSGRPVALMPTGFSPGAIAVGFTPAGVDTSGKLKDAWGIKDYNVSMRVLAPDVGSDQGLSVRSGKSRLAIRVYPTGFINVVEP